MLAADWDLGKRCCFCCSVSVSGLVVTWNPFLISFFVEIFVTAWFSSALCTWGLTPLSWRYNRLLPFSIRGTVYSPSLKSSSDFLKISSCCRVWWYWCSRLAEPPLPMLVPSNDPEFWFNLSVSLALCSGMNAATSIATMTRSAPKTKGGPGIMWATNSSCSSIKTVAFDIDWSGVLWMDVNPEMKFRTRY